MTLTVADIERWDADSVREVFHAASSRAQAAADAAIGLATLPAFNSWGGVAAEAARDAIGKTRKDLDAHGREARIVADAARSAADEIDRIGSDLAILKADAESMGMEIDSVSGKVLPGRSVRDRVEALLKEEQLQPRLNEIVAEANLIDMALANAIHMADGSVPFDHPRATPTPADASGASDQPKNLDAALSEVAGQPVAAPAAGPDSSLNQLGGGEGRETASARSPLTIPIIDADPAVVGRQRARVEAARQTLNAAQARLDAAATRRYTQGAGPRDSRAETDALSQAVFDARRDLTDQTRILEDLNRAAEASGLPTAAVPALPENAHVQAFPPQPSAIGEGSRALSEGSMGLIPDVAKDVEIFTNWGGHSGAEHATAVLDAAGLVPIPGAKGLTEGIGHGLDALAAARHLDDISTPHPHVDDVTAPHPSPDVPHHAADTPGTHSIGDDTGHVASYGVEDITGLLATSEAAGGHLMERHVGLTIDDLSARLESSRLPVASSFQTADEARAAIGAALEGNQKAVDEWLSNGALRYLELDAPFNGGMVLERGCSDAVAGNGVRVVLKGDRNGGWYVLTGFPTL